MSKERKLCDTLLHTRKMVDDVFDSFIIEYVMRGYISDNDLEKGLTSRLECLLQDRVRFIKNDLKLLQKEVNSGDKS